ncbi:MAG: hypothetical protein ACJATI_001049 [Halioglobus sp.]|jgi:hypothetical protein
MKNLLFIILSLQFFLISCNKEIDSYISYEVTFYKDHPNYLIQEHQLETITEQVLVRDAHNEGATFTTNTEQLLSRDAYISYSSLINQNKITIVTDCEIDSKIDLNCREFLDSINIVRIDNLAQYTTRTFETVLVNGNGSIVPATYTTRTYQKLVNNGELLPNLDLNRSSEQIIFKLPFGTSVDDYIQNEMYNNGVSNCFSGTSYIIN